MLKWRQIDHEFIWSTVYSSILELERAYYTLWACGLLSVQYGWLHQVKSHKSDDNKNALPRCDFIASKVHVSGEKKNIQSSHIFVDIEGMQKYWQILAIGCSVPTWRAKSATPLAELNRCERTTVDDTRMWLTLAHIAAIKKKKLKSSVTRKKKCYGYRIRFCWTTNNMTRLFRRKQTALAAQPTSQGEKCQAIHWLHSCGSMTETLRTWLEPQVPCEIINIIKYYCKIRFFFF